MGCIPILRPYPIRGSPIPPAGLATSTTESDLTRKRGVTEPLPSGWLREVNAAAGVRGPVPVGGFELSEQGGGFVGADGAAGGADAGGQRGAGEWKLLAVEVGGDGVAEVKDV